MLPKQSNAAYLVVGGPSAEFFYRYFEWQRSHGNILAFITPVRNGNAFLYGVPVVPISRMSSFLAKATAVYLLPDCPDPVQRTAIQLCALQNIPVHALQLNIETLHGGELRNAAIAS